MTHWRWQTHTHCWCCCCSVKHIDSRSVSMRLLTSTLYAQTKNKHWKAGKGDMIAMTINLSAAKVNTHAHIRSSATANIVNRQSFVCLSPGNLGTWSWTPNAEQRRPQTHIRCECGEVRAKGAQKSPSSATIFHCVSCVEPVRSRSVHFPYVLWRTYSVHRTRIAIGLA